MSVRSKVYYTEEMDDTADAVEDIFSQSADFTFGKNSVCLVFAGEEIEYEELFDLFCKKWTFPVVGVSTLGIFAGREGYKKDGIAVILMTSDDCTFAVGMTGQLTEENYTDEIRNTYNTLSGQLPEKEKEKIILTYGGMIKDVTGDEIVNAIESTGTDAIIYGGLASDSFSFRNYRVYCNTQAGTNTFIMIMISGNIDPVYRGITSVSGKTKFSYSVTKACGNIVYELEGMTFCDALRKAGLEADKTSVIADYVLSPFISTLEKDGVSIEVLRTLSALDQDDQSGRFTGGIREGSSMGIGLLNKADLQESVIKEFTDFLFENQSGNRKTLICTSCAARYLAMGGGSEVARINFWDEVPDDKELIGMYSYGEFCPVDTDDKKCINLFHNSTFTVLMF